MSLKLGDTRVYEPQIRARLGTTTHIVGIFVPQSQHVKLLIATLPPLNSVNGGEVGGLVFEARRLVYHSTLGLRVITKKKKKKKKKKKARSLSRSKVVILGP